MTLLPITSVGRARFRRCDARCYDGQGKRCRCVCGGMNHGVGLFMAQHNTLEHVADHPDDRVVFAGALLPSLRSTL